MFEINETVGSGLILWKPAGAILRKKLEEFLSEILRKAGYQQVYTPHIGKLALYRKSGHFPYYEDSQFTPIIDQEDLKKLSDEKCSCAQLSNNLREGKIEGYLLKPMNCPMHIALYQSEPRSYRDLPVRLAEFGTVYRWEQSGELNGLTRVRGFTQDDAHIFCKEEQLHEEIIECLKLVKKVLETLGMKEYRVRLGIRESGSEKYVGKKESWERAEKALKEAVIKLRIDFEISKGEAAFYGPKIDFLVKDVLGREWQLGTVQVDYNLPERFNLNYTGQDNKKHPVVMIHRAPFGSIERFVGILIEQFGGNFPTWLAPEQVRILSVSDKYGDYANEIKRLLEVEKITSTIDKHSEKLGGKIRRAEIDKIPCVIIVGEKEQYNKNVSVRSRVSKDLEGIWTLENFTEKIKKEISNKTLPDTFKD